MTESAARPASPTPDPPDSPQDPAPDAAGKFSITEDWLAVIVGLGLLLLVLTGLIPEGLLP